MVARRWTYGFALLVLCTSCQLWLGQYTADREDPVDVTELCDLERELFDIDLRLDSDAQLETLEAYYGAANPLLVEQFDRVVSAARDETPTRTATYLTGEAGAGKSFIMRALVSAFPSDDICDLSLPEILAIDTPTLPTKKIPDLATRDGAVTLNSLPGVSDPDAFSLPQFLAHEGCIKDGQTTGLVVLDGLDEVHPSSALALLREVEDYLLDDDGTFVHIVVLGRPEGFAPWFANPSRGADTGKVVKLMSLQTPQYVTRGDISFRLEEYLDFTMQLEDAQQGSQFEDHVDSMAAALERHPFLRYSLSNLAVGNVVIQHTAPGLKESEFTLKSKIFEDLLARNVDTHGRPGSGSRYDDAYIQVFERLAAKYSNVNDKGEFIVSPTDALPLVDASGEEIGEVLVTALLERSGVAYLASPTSTTKRFRFSPFWVHSYLTERFNRRVSPKYDYQGCD
jgi:hypothetical protein